MDALCTIGRSPTCHGAKNQTTNAHRPSCTAIAILRLQKTRPGKYRHPNKSNSRLAQFKKWLFTWRPLSRRETSRASGSLVNFRIGAVVQQNVDRRGLNHVHSEGVDHHSAL